MENIELIKEIRMPIIHWYQANKRELPWRKEKNPYHIWISEIMLQQTRIEAVKGYYDRFLKRLPTVKDLSRIEEDELLKLWEGLGYYNRARNLKKAAIIIEKEYHGIIPKTYEELVKLPGIGEYTAGAISSIAFNEKIPAVDGNVLRVLSRVIASEKDVLDSKVKKEFTEILKNHMPNEAGDFNEGLMELGERVCLPNGQPTCQECPLQNYCLAKKENLTNKIPVRNGKLIRRKEQKTVFLLEHENKVAIRKRESSGLLANLYEFPNVEGKLTIKEVKQKIKEWKLVECEIRKGGTHHHIFSHIEWDMVGFKVLVSNENTLFEWVEKEKLHGKYAIPGAFATFRDKI